MWTPVELPFKNENSSPLPTANEIRSCSHVIQRRSAKKVVALNDSVVAKFGSAIDVAEGQALIFLERFAPGVPAPRLHAMFRDGIEVFLVMERAPGMQLDAVWPSLTESEKSSVTSKLSRIFESMRQVECPWPDFFWRLGWRQLAPLPFLQSERRSNPPWTFPRRSRFCRKHDCKLLSSG